MSIATILLIIGLVSFLLAALKVPEPRHLAWLALGFAMWTAAWLAGARL